MYVMLLLLLFQGGGMILNMLISCSQVLEGKKKKLKEKLENLKRSHCSQGCHLGES